MQLLHSYLQPLGQRRCKILAAVCHLVALLGAGPHFHSNGSFLASFKSKFLLPEFSCRFDTIFSNLKS